MDHSLSVVVQIELDTRCVRLVVTGDLTEHNHRALTPLVGRARALFPDAAVAVDLTGAQHVDPEGLDLLRWSLEQGPVPEPGGSVRILTRPVPFGLAEASRPAVRAHVPAPAPRHGAGAEGVAA
ncbi:hypothetical protein RCG67_06845 [Kocuria sp. CPCC 205292]|uniref:hypothetical protein n=1 Tax=Kocuria cellulosilytica TaxID=3071451 RepID=UPI0034D68315